MDGLGTSLRPSLGGREIGVDDAFRAALAAEGNLEALRVVLRRSATAASAAEVLSYLSELPR